MMKKERGIQTAMLERGEGEAEKTASCLLFKLLQCHTFTHIFKVCQGNILGLKSKHLHISVFTISLSTVFQKWFSGDTIITLILLIRRTYVQETATDTTI